jgi:Na+/H+ antiporter NhaD/arsenite permease-like protein
MDKLPALCARWIKHPTVLAVCLVVAAASCVLVPPSSAYAGYFDVRTLVCLTCMLVAIEAMRSVRVFRSLAARLIATFKTRRALVMGLVFITGASSMLMTNDVALLTFLPTAYYALKATGNLRYLAFTFVMQNTAANLCGMLLPFGNPQNLYLHSVFNIPTGSFILTMLPSFAVSVVLIALCCLRVKNDPITAADNPEPINARKFPIPIALFVWQALIVLRVVPLEGSILTILVALLACRKAFTTVDYGLLATFICFFIIAGNLVRIPAVEALIAWGAEQNVLLSGVILSQITSNVPAALLLAPFTGDYAQLLVAVNIGGVGTLVASLASLITLNQFMRYQPQRTPRFLRQFTALGFATLAILVACALLLERLGIGF